MRDNNKMSVVDVATAIVVPILWGINYVAVKIGVMNIPPIFLMTVRFSLVAVLLLPWLYLVERQQLLPLLIISLTMGVGYSLLFLGMRTVPAGETTIIMQLQIPFAALMARFFLKEHLSARKNFGAALGLIGVVITVGLPQHSGERVGVLLVLLGAFVWSVAANQIRAVGKIHALVLNGFNSLCVFPILGLISLIAEPGAWHSLLHITWQVSLAIFFMVVVATIIGYSLWFKLLSRNPVSHVTPFIILSPPAALLTSHFVLGEPIYMHTIVGGLLCLIGLVFVTI